MLPSNGSSGGSPASKLPPTFRGIIHAKWSGSSTYTIDTALEPVWTWYANNFRNERTLRDDGDVVFSCTNDPDRCVTQSASTVRFELDASLNNTPGSADLMADLKNTILPAWSGRTGSVPAMTWCSAGCSEHVLVKVVPMSDPDLNANLAVTIRDGGFTSGTPAFFNHQTLLIGNQTYDHPCGSTDNGCGPSEVDGDPRPLISHEIGHTLGLGHCDIDLQVMCHIRSTLNDELTEGTSYWTPQRFDVRALKAFYP